MTSALIIDDHPIVLQGCRRVLLDAGVDTVIDAHDVVSGYRLYRRSRPDVVIVDLALQGNGLAGLPLIQRIRAHDPRSRILVFSMHSDPIIIARALRAGASGYLLKDTSPRELVEAFEKVRAGAHRFQPAPPAWPACRTGSARRDPLSELTPRELQMLALLAEGKSYGRISEQLAVSYKTVVNTCSQLKRKLNAENLPDLIRMAVRLVPART